MNTSQISLALKNNAITGPLFRGVFAADTVPASMAPFPGSCIINTDPSDKPGAHWIALFQDQENTIESFDSFGKDFGFYGLGNIDLLLNEQIIKQNDKIQSDSNSTCGQHCLFLLSRRASGKKYSDIVHLFTSSTVSNDAMVCQYINHHFDLKTKIRDADFLEQMK